jgi:hypothetical protein
MPTAIFVKRRSAGRCQRHGLVLVDGEQCALCRKSAESRITSPWLVVFLGGVVLAALFGARWLDRDQREDARVPVASARPSGTLATRVEHARPAFERVPGRREPAPSEPGAAPAPPSSSSESAASATGARSSAGVDAVPAEDRLLGQSAPEPTSDQRARPPEAPGARGFPNGARDDDPSDFE